MTLSIIAVVFGLALLVWGADRFVEGSAVTARHFGMPPLLIGMVIVGFGPSVMAFAGRDGSTGLKGRSSCPASSATPLTW